MSQAVLLTAPAKINLTLEVLGRRADGYHDLASVFATIALRDRIRVAPSRKLDVRIAPDVGAPNGDDLASRAVRALAGASGRPARAYVRIKKRIPVAAGLGGGSSDAAAVLLGLVRAWRLEGVDLGTIGAGIGSDVPFFASRAPFALVSGRGERVEPLPGPPTSLWIALVRLRERVSTQEIFAAHRVTRSRGERSASLADAFRSGAVSPGLIREHFVNDLATDAERVVPAITDARRTASEAGVALAMSGSGPSLFALADDRADALRIARRLRRAGLRARAIEIGVTS
ncbi:MAG TPA: 4-(cytidine 5'-diphospho)-2-C-methyl-D-erythritol kinase [Candidatus Limnocylindria bacterium]|nr:4-(cytidine 5'-diphospho)-2-C-methyl-D-erythritol kinase [Candidatus Limnocylindria bacterium]